MDVTTRDFRLIEGHAGVAVRVGDRVVGFSGEDVSAVSLRVAEGKLHIQLRNESGGSLGDYRIPSTDLLRSDLQALSGSGLYFSPREVEELQNLMRLTMTGGVSRQEIMLMLDELSRPAPGVAGTLTLDAGDLYPDLNRQVRQLMTVMPEDIQRFVILNNMDRFPPDLWDAFHLISKVDVDAHPAMARFLEGRGAFTYVAAAELRELAAQNPLARVQPIAKLDSQAFEALLKHMEGLEVAGDHRTFRFGPGLARFVLEQFDLHIPDFTAAESFEALEEAFMARFKAAHPLPGRAEDPLKQRLLRGLDSGRYRELADFLSGKAGAVFGTEAREGFLHWLRHPAAEAPGHTPASIADKPYERLLHFVRHQKLDLPELLLRHPHAAISEDPADPVFMARLGKDWHKLSGPERLALYVLDHIDPVRDGNLFRYFNGDQQGLAKMTPGLLRDLHAFLGRGTMPEVRGTGLTRFAEKPFQELVAHLAGKDGLAAPEDFLPTNPRLRRAVYELTEGHAPAAPEETPRLVDLPSAPAGRRNTKLLAELILRDIADLAGRPRDARLTEHLSQHLARFRQVAVLDQAWKGTHLLDRIGAGEVPAGEGGRELVRVLRTIGDLLAGEDTVPEWDLWRQKPEHHPVAPGRRPTLAQRLMEAHPGLERYFHLDDVLPEHGPELSRRVEELGWMRRMDELAERIERRRDDNPARLQAALRRAGAVLDELAGVLTKGEGSRLDFHGKSPLTREKLAQFQAFKDAVAVGRSGDVDQLFEGPFLREAFSGSERTQTAEMKRLEPLFKDALSRFETEPGRVLDRLMDMLGTPADGGDSAAHVRRLVGNLHEFNQHQNLNQQPMYLQLPLKWGDQESEMELAYFRLPGQGKQRRFLVVIHLDFPDWGHLRVDALKEDARLSATFWVDSVAMSARLQKDMPRLTERLSGQGVGPVDLSVKIEPKRAESSVARLCVPGHDGEVDLQI